jgi:histidyl-tRNA synthetase
VFRNEKPGPGRFRQFMQFDADTVGASSVAADAENCMMFADAMEALGIPRGSYVVKVNNRKVLDGVMEAIKIGGPEHAGTRLTVLRAIDKMDKFPVEEIRKLLGSGRWDGGEAGKGDFTKGANLTNEQIDALFETLVISGDDPNSVYAKWSVEKTGEQSLDSYLLFEKGMFELMDIQKIVRASGYGPDRIRIDPSVVRGLEYYTGPVYEVELTFDVPGDDGKPVRFGSVGGGGRYDGLIGRFRAEDVPAAGISIGVSRLQAALTHLGKLKSEPPEGPVVVTVMDKARIAEYQQMVSELRAAGIKSELYLGDASSFGPQLKYCDRRNSPLAIIQGGDELARGEVQIKDLKKGAALAASAKTITDRDEFQRLRAEAQYAVPREGLVEAVRKALES